MLPSVAIAEAQREPSLFLAISASLHALLEAVPKRSLLRTYNHDRQPTQARVEGSSTGLVLARIFWLALGRTRNLCCRCWLHVLLLVAQFCILPACFEILRGCCL